MTWSIGLSQVETLTRLHGPVIAVFGSQRTKDRCEVRWKSDVYWCSCRKSIPKPFRDNLVGGADCPHIKNAKARGLPTPDMIPPVDLLVETIRKAIEDWRTKPSARRTAFLPEAIAEAVRALPTIDVPKTQTNTPPKKLRLIVLPED